jgi:hypothetical protein
MGLYFSSHINLTNTRQRAYSADSTKPLWHRSDSDTWYNAALCEPLCREPLFGRTACFRCPTLLFGGSHPQQRVLPNQ